MTSRWEEYKAKNGVTPLDLLNPKTKKADPALTLFSESPVLSLQKR
jgi:hypothetical protein